MKRLGLVGGISWVSTIDYYRRINEGVNAKRGGLHYADCIVRSLDFGAVQDVGWDKALPLLARACADLKSAGAEAIVLCASTAHLHLEALRASVDLPFIDIVDAAAAEVVRHGLTRVGLLATQFVMQSDLYARGFARAGIEVLIPDSEASRDHIQFTLKEELGRGLFSEETKRFYLQEIASLRARGAQGVILGCTEIPLFLNQGDCAVPLFDTLQIHAAAAVGFALSE